MTYLVDGELVDTYGGDFTYRHVWYEIEDGEYLFFEMYTGAKSSPTRQLSMAEGDGAEIAEFMAEIVGE